MSGSSNPLKNPLYWQVKQDSRASSELGRLLGWDGLRDEGKYNQKNPGHAITKAGEYALAAYLGGILGGGGGTTEGGMDAVQAGENVGSMGPMAGGAAAGTAATAEQLAAQQAMQQAPQGLANTMESGMTDSGYTPSTLWNALNNSSSANGTPLTSNLANYGKAAATNVQNGGLLNQLTSGSGGTAGNKAMMAQQGLKMMFPEQQGYRPPPSQPMQGSQAALPNMYENKGTYGTSAGNSMGFTEEQKKKLRDLGYKI